MATKAKKSKSKTKSKVTDSSNDLVVNYKIPEEETNLVMQPPPKKKKAKKDSIKAPTPTPPTPITEPTSVKINLPPKQRITKSIYFADAASIEHLESMISAYPKSSLSSVIQQLVQALVQADNNERVVEIKAKIYL